MGPKPSKTSQNIVQEQISQTLMNVIVSHTQNCSSKADVKQSIDIKGGNSSSVVLSDIKFDAQVAQKLSCLMSASLTTADIQQIKAQFASDLSQSTIKFPNLTSVQNSQALTQKLTSYLTSNIDVSSIMNSAQEANIEQNIAVTVGDRSSVIINKASINAGLQMFQDACTDAVQSNISNMVTDLTAKGQLTQSEVNALQPFADVATNISHDVAGIASNAILAAVLPIVAVVFVVGILAFVFFKSGGSIGSIVKSVGKLTPMGMAASMVGSKTPKLPTAPKLPTPKLPAMPNVPVPVAMPSVVVP
jgi:hypothetical protein